MSRRFTEARALLGDLLDRHENGAASPIGYPDYAGFADVVAMDRFIGELRDAERHGAVRLAMGQGRVRSIAELKSLLQAAGFLRARIHRTERPWQCAVMSAVAS